MIQKKVIINFQKALLLTGISGLFLVYSFIFLFADYFTGQGVNGAFLFHLRYGVGGAGFSEYKWVIVLSAIFLLLSFAAPLVYFLRSRKEGQKASNKGAWLIAAMLIFSAFAISPTSYGLANYYFNFHQSQELQDSDFYKSYLPPHAEKSGKPMNVVYIYAESLERTYFDEKLFPGLIKYLRFIEGVSTSFLQINEITGTEWTIAGIVSTLCGLPLSTPSHGNSMYGMDRFLPEAVCSGDLLSQAGYNLTYLSGSSLDFAGTGKFFENHGFNEVIGLRKLGEILQREVDLAGWGLHDDLLFDFAFEKFQSLSKQEKPFGLFISTLDTHNPYGRQSQRCGGRKYQNGQNPILNAVACSDYLISDFILKIWKSENSNNTIIVVTSDHLAMRNTATSILETGDRKNLFMIHDPRKSDENWKGQKVEKIGTMLDVMPTLMPFLGFKADLGLGRNLLGEEPSLIAQYDDFKQAAKAWEKPLQDFWGFPALDVKDDVFTINPENKQLSIKKRTFTFPLLLEFNRKGKSKLRFSFDISLNQKTLADHQSGLDQSMFFLWIDQCANINAESSPGKDDYCFAYGKGKADKIMAGKLVEKVEIPLSGVLAEKSIGVGEKWIKARPPVDKMLADKIIAHAGGQIDGNTYTNSLEALNESYKRGYRLFELDIIRTADERYVAAHDWEHWKKITGYEGKLPPTLETFKKQKLMEKYTSLVLEDINQWFGKHPDAVLVTDKVNSPADFADKFIDKNRLMMELFTPQALEEGSKLQIKAAMPTWNLLMGYQGDKVKLLTDLGITAVAASRAVVNEKNMPLLKKLKQKGIRVYLFHVNFEKGKDETYVFCNDLKHAYGMYADRFDFEKKINCTSP